MTTQPESLSDIGQTFTANETSGSADGTTLSGSMSSSEDSPAKIFPTPGKGQDLKENAADCSSRPFAWFANYDREQLCWRTWQGCLLEGWTEFSGRWPRLGLMRNGIAYRLPPLVPRISGTGCSLWLTPRASDTGSGESQETFVKRNRDRTMNCSGSLAAQVKERPMWPTPKSSAAGQDYAKMHGRDNRKPGAGLSLATMAAMYPTPKSRDWKGQSQRGIHGPMDSLANQDRGDGKPIGGQLNPTWVEWLMGFPLGWTASDASATPSSRKLRK